MGLTLEIKFFPSSGRHYTRRSSLIDNALVNNDVINGDWDLECN